MSSGKHEEVVHRRKRGQFLPFFILRLFLTIILLFIFGIGVYQAFRYFSGVDPIKINPESMFAAFLSPEKSIAMIETLLEIDVPESVEKSLMTKSEEKVLSIDREDVGNLANELSSSSNKQDSNQETKGEIIVRFALIADSHTDNKNLVKALSKAKEEDAKFVIGLGDYSEVGTLQELKEAKAVFDASGMTYYLTAGDHDLWDARDKGLEPDSRFRSVFGRPYRSFGDGNILFIILFNSDNYFGIDAFQMDWLEEELTKIKNSQFKQIFVFLHEPLYHPSSDHVMGKLRPKVADQAKELITLFDENNVSAVFSGDTHFFSEYQEPKTKLPMITVGAVTEVRNIQNPRFAIVDVFEDGSYNVSDIEIKQ